MDSYNNKNSYDEFEEKAKNFEKDGTGDSKTLSKEKIIQLLKKPKNIFICIGTLIFIILIGVKLLSSKPQKPFGKPAVDENRIPASSNVSQIGGGSIPDSVLNQVPSAPPQVAAPSVNSPPLPTLDVSLFDNIKNANTAPELDSLDNIDIKKLREELASPTKEEEQDDLNSTIIPSEEPETPAITKVRKANPDAPPPSLIIETKVPPFIPKKQSGGQDFIFVDSAFTAEASTDVPLKGQRLNNAGNLIAQGKKIDVILETAIDSSLPGTVRAIVSKDVYAEAGRSVLIPRGTRLYGMYNVGGGKSGRVTIGWTRILRPDGISLSISGQAADQFGRAGIGGNVDKKYGEMIVSALLLASIPLVATIASEQITGGRDRPRGATFTGQNGITITTADDPVNIATERFTNEIAKATEQVVKNLIDTTLVVSIPQGTKVSMFVNQDAELPAIPSDVTQQTSYITRASSAAY